MILSSSSLNQKKGFTIVETMLSMVFLSILIIGIAIVTNQVISVYQKGVILKSVNRVGQSISDDFHATIVNSPSLGAVRIENEPTKSYGAMCLGNYSYVWNKGDIISGTTDDLIAYYGFEPSDRANIIRLIKVPDSSMKICDDAKDGKLQKTIVRDNTIVELIKPGDDDLAIQDLKILTPLINPVTGEKITVIQFVLGTFNSYKLINTANNSCQPGDDFEYCAINKFELTVRSIK